MLLVKGNVHLMWSLPTNKRNDIERAHSIQPRAVIVITTIIVI